MKVTGELASGQVVALLCEQRHAATISVGLQPPADAVYVAETELPFADRTVAKILLGDGVLTLSLRGQVRLLAECRRSLRAGAQIVCVESRAQQAHAALAHWAELVGLQNHYDAGGAPGWRKRQHPRVEMPMVSILIPSSNPAYFAECLDSAIAQDYINTEIIVCDDCRTDGIAAIVRERAHPRVRYEHNTEQLRARLNFERCLSLAGGEFVKFLNDDDLLAPNCVSAFVDAFRRVPDLVLATSHRWRIDARSAVLPDIPATQPVFAADHVVEGISLLNAVVMYGLNFIGEPSTAMFRRSDFDHRPHCDGDRPFHFDGQEVRGAIDLAMWSRLLIQGNAAFLAARLSAFRQHSEQAQARPDVIARSVEGIRGLQAKWIELGLFNRLPPNLVSCQRLEQAADGVEWHTKALLSLPTTATSIGQAIGDWRAVSRHPFDAY